MQNLFSKLWADDAGIVTIEYLVLGVFLALALIVGVTTLGSAINVELVELAQSILAFDNTYSASGFSTCNASKNGSAVTDTYASVNAAHFAPAPVSINVDQCL